MDDQYTRLRALINYPIKIKDKDYLIVGGEYNKIILNLEGSHPFNTGNLNRLHIIDLSLGYTRKTSDNRRFAVRLNSRIASKLTNKLTSGDMFLNGSLFAIKDRTDTRDIEKPYRLVLGQA